ncbi:MAG: AbrB family transcriptional regulator [Rubrobacter sp.]|nr:AbrB family transcriptional regulator [Rubrobacter sp.]
MSPAAAVSLCAAGAVGAAAARALRLPASGFIGAMAGVGLALGLMGFPNLGTPQVLGGALQCLVGVLVGFRMERDAVRSGTRALLPAATLAALFLVSGLLAAYAATALTGIHLKTALFAAATGGLTEMATIGASQGANGPVVAAVHLVRLLLVILVASLLVGRLRRKHPAAPSPGEVRSDAGSRARLAAIAAAGVFCGLLGLAATPLPAGGVVGSMLGSGAARMLLPGPVPERGFQFAVQALAGGVVGLGLNEEFFRTLHQLAGAALLINAVQISAWLLAFYLLVRSFGLDSETAAFASAPGGMGTTLSIIGETRADLVAVAFTHLFRVSTTVVAVPLLSAALTGP